jgi:hypothetical protein
MNETLRNLLQLQAIDTEHIALQRRLKAGPKEVEARRQERDAALAEAEAKQADLQKEKAAADEAELEAKSAEQDIDRFKKKLNTVKNNKEYNMVRGAITEADRRRQQHEEVVLGHMERVEAIQAEYDDHKARADQLAERLEATEKEVEAEEAELRPQAEAVKKRRREMASRIPEEDLAIYEQVIRSNRGVALVPMRDGACQGCFVTPSPNIENLVLLGRELVRCPGCGRFLYIENEEQAEAGV